MCVSLRRAFQFQYQKKGLYMSNVWFNVVQEHQEVYTVHPTPYWQGFGPLFIPPKRTDSKKRGKAWNDGIGFDACSAMNQWCDFEPFLQCICFSGNNFVKTFSDFSAKLSDSLSRKSTVRRNIKMEMFFMKIVDWFTIRIKHTFHGPSLLKPDAQHAMRVLQSPEYITVESFQGMKAFVFIVNTDSARCKSPHHCKTKILLFMKTVRDRQICVLQSEMPQLSENNGNMKTRAACFHILIIFGEPYIKNLRHVKVLLFPRHIQFGPVGYRTGLVGM